MTKNVPILACITNFSYGKTDERLQKLIYAINNIQGQKLIHVDNNISANRTVITFAGSAPYVVEAAFQAIKTAAEFIDMSTHTGVHPRIGATDVCPLVPIAHCSMQQAAQWAEMLAERVGRKLHIPVYCYEFNAKKSYRRSLPQIRKGNYEGFLEKMQLSDWKPDYGPGWDSPYQSRIIKTGATVIGARKILIAYNVPLATRSAAIAHAMARRLRSSGYKENKKQIPGMFNALRAIGWYIEDFGTAQVSMNFTDYKQTGLLPVWQAIREMAQEYGTTALGGEVIGLIPEACILEAGYFASGIANPAINTTTHPEEDRDRYIDAGIEYLGLNRIRPFNPRKQILEYALQDAGVL